MIESAGRHRKKISLCNHCNELLPFLFRGIENDCVNQIEIVLVELRSGSYLFFPPATEGSTTIVDPKNV